MATFKELGDSFELELKKIEHFKIGKTGQTVEDRYSQEYADDYDYCKIIGSAKEASVIDNFEKYMIERFKGKPNCDNEQIGGGEMTKSDKYIVYLMYNK